MSTGLNCNIIEPRPNEWYYVLEDCGAPKNAWDWREYATATGPFTSKKTCLDYMLDHESNPGGFSTISNDEWGSDDLYEKLVREANAPKPYGQLRIRLDWS